VILGVLDHLTLTLDESVIRRDIPFSQRHLRATQATESKVVIEKINLVRFAVPPRNGRSAKTPLQPAWSQWVTIAKVRMECTAQGDCDCRLAVFTYS